MVKVKPQHMFDYFNNVLCVFRANYLDDESIRLFLIYSIEIYKNHHKEYSCWCF